jgi:hypothetical protein
MRRWVGISPGLRRVAVSGIVVVKPVSIDVMNVGVRSAIVIAVIIVDMDAVVAANFAVAVIGGRPAGPAEGPRAFQPPRCC